MRVSSLFPVQVVEDEIEVDDLVPRIEATIASGFLDGAANDKRSALGNSWRSRLDLHDHVHWSSDTVLVPLIERVREFTSRAIVTIYNDPPRNTVTGRVKGYRLGECWLNKLGRGGYHAAHDHYPYHWSGVLWIRAEGPEGDDPNGAFEFMSPYHSRALNNPDGSLLIHPINGVAILFPSGLKHMVHPVQTDRTRISLAWNIYVEHTS